MELAGERENYIDTKHDGVFDDDFRFVRQTLLDPDVALLDARSNNTRAICRWYHDLKNGKYAVVVVVSDEAQPPRQWIATHHRQETHQKGPRMAARVVFESDKVGDILHIDRVQPYPVQEVELLDDFVVARYNPTTGRLEGLETLSFSERLNGEKVFELPVDAFDVGARL